jgi:hypothetical protein
LGSVFIVCAPGLVFVGNEGVGSCFHVLRARTRFHRYRGRRVPFSCYDRPDSFSAVPRASGPVFMFCACGLIFGGKEGVGSHMNVLLARIHFRRYRGRRVPFSCYARPDSFFGRTEGVGSHFHVLRALTHFRRYRGRRVPFECFARQDSFSTVPRASAPVFMLCAPGRIFGGNEDDGSLFNVLRARTRFRR